MIADEQTGLNSAIAATLTRCVGSMPALYAVLVFVGGWMALATWGPLHRALSASSVARRGLDDDQPCAT
jgi:putative effector of murein hydrolase